MARPPVDDPARKVCLPDGVPRILETPYPFEVFQLPPGQVTFVHELNHQVRAIPLNVPLPSYEESVLLPAYGETATAGSNQFALNFASQTATVSRNTM